jgi:hypothetical protein
MMVVLVVVSVAVGGFSQSSVAVFVGRHKAQWLPKNKDTDERRLFCVCALLPVNCGK